MGTFKTKLRIANVNDPARSEELELWVDTGAAFSWISRSRLEALGIVPVRRMQFRTIEGRVIERQLASASVTVESYTDLHAVVMAEPGDLEVMGAHSIEGLGLAADVVQKKLVPTIGLALRAARVGLRRRSRVIEYFERVVQKRLVRIEVGLALTVIHASGFSGSRDAQIGAVKIKTEFFERVGENRFRRIPD